MNKSVWRELDTSVFIKPIPKYIMNCIKKYYEVYGVGLSDAIEGGFREKANNKNTIWWKMWYYNDFREICPSIYLPEYLDFEKYPLKYKEV